MILYACGYRSLRSPRVAVEAPDVLVGDLIHGLAEEWEGVWLCVVWEQSRNQEWTGGSRRVEMQGVPLVVSDWVEGLAMGGLLARI